MQSEGAWTVFSNKYFGLIVNNMEGYVDVSADLVAERAFTMSLVGSMPSLSLFSGRLKFKDVHVDAFLTTSRREVEVFKGSGVPMGETKREVLVNVSSEASEGRTRESGA